MRFQCQNQGCQKTFIYPASIQQASQLEGQEQLALIETHVCPYCRSLDFSEFVESAIDTANVYIYDLSSGPQTTLDGLLAQGYRIVSRYAKAYHLEKPKEAKPDLKASNVELDKETADLRAELKGFMVEA